MNKIKLVITFYNSFALLSILITFFSMAILYANGIRAFTALFWFKITSLAIIVYFIEGYKKKEFYYYRNLGFTNRRLWGITLVVDMVIFILSLILILSLR